MVVDEGMTYSPCTSYLHTVLTLPTVSRSPASRSLHTPYCCQETSPLLYSSLQLVSENRSLSARFAGH